jgi:hypothetical protein
MAAEGLYDPDTELSPEPNGSNSHPPILLLSGPLQHYFPPVLWAFKKVLLFRIYDQNSCCISLSPMNAICLTHHILSDLIIIVFGDSTDRETVKYVIISSLSAFPPLTGPNILFSTLFSH